MKNLVFVLVITVCHLSFSQVNIKISSLDSGGGSFNSGGLSVVSTVGEVAINDYTVNLLSISEGFIGKSLFSQNSNCIEPPSNLVGWWKAEDNADDSASNNHGAALGGTSYSSGVVNNAFLFDGVDDAVVVPHSNVLDITGDITVEIWVLQTVFNLENIIVCKGALGKPTVFSMRLSGATLNCAFQDTTGTNVELTGPSFEDWQWHHYVYVRQGNQHAIYADGFNFGWEPFTNPPASSAGLPLTIGAQYDNQNDNYVNFFGGQIDEVSVYNRALSEIEIQDIYNTGSDGKCSLTLSNEEVFISENELILYPNPVSDVLTLKLNNESDNGIFELYDSLGKLVKVNNLSSYKTEINVSALKSGLYFYHIKDQNLVLKSGKLVKR
ncbi:T9SS type A sorting domain-containing protein [Seonamhaeicola sp. MEBiC1930]|uniref:LamG-like jellyroll fold domain-containing protein n=1 Tax=Seonamhaeicola sp. MEBiC01930 TaxID=2976768 RepID=UPI003245776E